MTFLFTQSHMYVSQSVRTEVCVEHQIHVTAVAQDMRVIIVRQVCSNLGIRNRQISLVSHFFLAACVIECQNGGVCSAPNTCNCSGTGYEGDHCETGMFLSM